MLRWLAGWSLLPLAVLAPGTGAAGPAAAAANGREEVDLLLVLAIDASGSTEEGAFGVQLQGHAAALRSPEVAAAIEAGPLGRIAAAAIVWSDDAVQRRCVEWTLIAGALDAARFADALLRTCRFIGGGTSLAGAIRNGTSVLGWSPFDAPRRVIDISGNEPRPVPWLDDTRRRALAAGITINAIVVPGRGPEGGGAASTAAALAFFRQRIIGGRGAFAVVATPGSYTEALLRKLVVEIAGVAPPG